MNKSYLIVSPVVHGKFLQDEVVPHDQLEPDVAWLEQNGAIREVLANEEPFPSDLQIRTFILPTSFSGFALWLASITGTPKLSSVNFSPKLGLHQFPIGNGTVFVARADPSRAEHETVEGYRRVALHSGYWNVNDIAPEELQAHEPISFRLIALGENSTKVQARCGVEALSGYFQELLRAVIIRWPNRDLATLLNPCPLPEHVQSKEPLLPPPAVSSIAVPTARKQPEPISGQSVLRPLEVFIAYSHRDNAMHREFVTRLRVLERQRLIAPWHDKKLIAGTEWRHELDKHLESAHIIILLVSSYFLDSDFCYSVEMARAVERHKAGEARVIPVILRESDWLHTPLKDLQALPQFGKPVDKWSIHNDAYVNAANGIREAITQLRTDFEGRGADNSTS